MNEVFYLQASEDKNFIWKITFYEPNNCKNDSTTDVNMKTIYFGDMHCRENYTTCQNIQKKIEYIKSMENKWDTKDKLTAEFWNRWLLFNKSTIEKSIEDVEKRFQITIVYEMGKEKTISKKIKGSCVRTIRATDRQLSSRLLALSIF